MWRQRRRNGRIGMSSCRSSWPQVSSWMDEHLRQRIDSDSDHPQDGQKNDVKSRKLSWPIAKGQNWLGTIGKAPREVSRWSPKPCPIQLSMLEPATVIRVQLASYAFEEVFSQPALRVKDGETRGAFMSFWKNNIFWKKYCNRFCKTLNTGTLPRNPPFHWKAELIFKSYRLQECRNFLVHLSVAPNLLSFWDFSSYYY